MKINSNITNNYSSEFTIQDLINANTHFGHIAKFWNPDIKCNLYGKKNNIHIIDVRKTYIALQKVSDIFYKIGMMNKKILFVGTDLQIAPLIKEYAEKCEQFYINNGWMGGTLTNWYTVSKSIKTLLSYNKVIEDLENGLSKKEISSIIKKRNSLMLSLGGIINMKGRPDIVFAVSTIKDSLAIKEASTLSIPVVSIIDSNSSTNGVTYQIPGNDDGTDAVRLYLEILTNAYLTGVKDSMVGAGFDIKNMIKNVP